MGGAAHLDGHLTGYQDIAEFNRAELMVAPALQTEGKQLQREQGSAWAPTATAAILVND